MNKFLTHYFRPTFSFLLLLFLFANSNTGRSQKPQKQGSFSFSGVIGNKETPNKVIISSVSDKQLIADCSFFGGDTLKGFNIVKVARSFGSYEIYFELLNFVRIKENIFVKKKYGIAQLPSEKRENKNYPSPVPTISAACSNLDFESGNFNSWTGTHGYNSSSNAPFTYVNAGINYNTNGAYNDCKYYSLITKTFGNDHYGSFTGVGTIGGNYCARIGSDGINLRYDYAPTYCVHPDQNNSYSSAEDLQQSFVVTAANALLTYGYAVVLSDGGSSHIDGEQPYFEAVVTNAGGVQLSSCTQYKQQVVSNTIPPGFIVSPLNSAVYYRPWTYNSVNLTPYIGQTVMVKFIASGCIYGGHFGYAYVDATCGPAVINTSNAMPCAGSQVTLTAPSVAGGTYSWIPTAGIIGSQTSQTAVINTSGTYSVIITPSQGASCRYTLSFSVNFPTISAPISSATNVNCFGNSTGTATINPSGGYLPYTYAWTNGQTTSASTGLSVGNYTVTIRDAGGCTKTTTVAITQPNAALTNTVSILSNASCFGYSNGTAKTTTANGSSPYLYSWTNGQTTSIATGLSASSYTVIITDNNGCTNTSTLTITQPLLLTSTISITNVACSGNPATATLTPKGGTPGYAYLWTPGGKTTPTASGLATGTYTAFVTDSKGCTTSNAMNITVTSAPSVTVSSTQTGCTVINGTAAAFGSGGPTPYSYLWSNGQTTSVSNALPIGLYSVSVTNAWGCTKMDTISVTQTTNPTVTASSTQAGCTVANGTATANPSGGTGSSYTFLWSPSGKTSNPATALAANTYSILITDVNGCIGTGTINITATTAPVAAVSNIMQATCGNNNGYASASGSGGTLGGYNYSWSPGGMTSQNITGLSANVYVVTVTDPNGCTDTEFANVTNADGPDVTTTVTTNILCHGDITGVASAFPTGGTPAYTYLWSNGQTTTTATGLSAGTQVIKVSDANGCVAFFTAVITQPSFSLSATVPSLVNVSCYGGNNGNAVVNASGGTQGSGYSYHWSNGQTSQTTTGLTVGTYTVGVTDANGCATSSSVTITQPTLLTTTTSTQTNILCNGGNNGDATVNPIGGTLGYTFFWSNGQTTQKAIGLYVGDYFVTITDKNGCIASSSLTITQPAISLSATLLPVNVSCNGGNDASATLIPIGGTSGYKFLWDNGQTTQTISGLTIGLYNAGITDANGCTTTNSVTITEPTVLTSTLSSTNVSCYGGNNGTSTLISLGGTPGYLYVWSTGQTTQNVSGLTMGNFSVVITDTNGCTLTLIDSISQPSILATPSSQTNILCNGNKSGTVAVNPSGGTPIYFFLWNNGQTTASITGIGIGNYSVTTTDSKGCSNTNTFVITEPPLLTSALSQANVLCNGGISGSASVIASGGSPVYSYAWSNGLITPSITGITIGIYFCIITDANNCTNTNTFSITQPTLLTSTASQTNILCTGGTSSASVTTSGGIPAYIYNWSNGQSTTSITGLAGNYSVTITDMNGCTNVEVFSITEPSMLSLSLSGNDSICFGETSVLNVSPTGGTPNYSYFWMPCSQNIQTISVTPSSSTTYTVTVTDANGCSLFNQTFNVSVLPLPVALFDTTSKGKFSSTFSFTDLGSGGTSWLWNFGDGSTSKEQNPIHKFLGVGTYKVTQYVFNQFGCIDTFKIDVNFMDGIVIPNVFTPNGDGINDVWYIPNSGMSEFQVAIYDRWGLKIFESTSDEIRWDGRSSSGIQMTDGTYYFQLKAILKSVNGNKDSSTRGSITLLNQKHK
jgi:large repetitive protein